MVDDDPQHRGRPGDPRRQNKQVRDAARAVGLTDEQRYAFRRRVERESRAYGEDMGYADLLELAMLFRGDMTP